MVAIDSEIPSICDQAGLIDDLLYVEGWLRGGSVRVVEMPRALAFVYHHIVGALYLDQSRHNDAMNLLTRQVRNKYGSATGPIWKDHELMGWVDSLAHDCLNSWKYVRSLWTSRKWLGEFFHSRAGFVDGYRAYVALASAIELADFLGRGGTHTQLEGEMMLDVPAMFVHPEDSEGANLSDIVARAIPSRRVLGDIVEIGGCSVEDFRAGWPLWFRQWLQFLSGSYLVLAHELGTGGPPALPQ